MITFTVPGDPVPKARARVVKGHGFTPKRTREHEQRIRDIAKLIGVPQAPGPVAVTIAFFTETRRRCDWDNLAKCVTDALNPRVRLKKNKKTGLMERRKDFDPWGAYTDDAQIVRAVVTKTYDKANPRTVVTIEALPTEDDLMREAAERAGFGG